MNNFSSELAKRLSECEAETVAARRGKKFEELLDFVFSSVSGSMVERDTRNHFGAEQVDLVVGHDGQFPLLPSVFLVECKDYQHAVDSKAVGYFLFICLSRRVSVAVIVAANGLTGDPADSSYAHSLALAASAMGTKLIVITRADLLALTDPSDLPKLLSQRMLRATANGGVGAPD
jgi:hypothetical protein